MSMLHDITARAPRNKRSQRKGRGESSGRGKTAGRGTKGAKARVGKYVKRGHEHGQTPIYRRGPGGGGLEGKISTRDSFVTLSGPGRGGEQPARQAGGRRGGRVGGGVDETGGMV